MVAARRGWPAAAAVGGGYIDAILAGGVGNDMTVRVCRASLCNVQCAWNAQFE